MTQEYNYFVIGASFTDEPIKCSNCGCSKFKVAGYSGSSAKSTTYLECIECGYGCRLETDDEGTEYIPATPDGTSDNARAYGVQE
jgi:hypothetical protein